MMNSTYHIDLQAFAAKLVADKRLVLAETLAKESDLFAIIETGRRYDRVRVIAIESEIAFYFIERATGNIYGPRGMNKLEPNHHHYYGHVSMSAHWDWRGHHGVPVSDPTIYVKKHYKHLVLYAPLTTAAQPGTFPSYSPATN
jgi:hypothetical protein